MNDRGPFLWLSKKAPPAGFSELPRGGMCVCTFLFVTRDDRILLGKYADDPKWEELAGLDQGRRLTNANGWTIPASHLKFGRSAADRAADRRADSPHARRAVFGTAHRGRCVPVPVDPWRDALRHLVLRRRGAAEDVRGAGSGMVPRARMA